MPPVVNSVTMKKTPPLPLLGHGSVVKFRSMPQLIDRHLDQEEGEGPGGEKTLPGVPWFDQTIVGHSAIPDRAPVSARVVSPPASSSVVRPDRQRDVCRQESTEALGEIAESPGLAGTSVAAVAATAASIAYRSAVPRNGWVAAVSDRRAIAERVLASRSFLATFDVLDDEDLLDILDFVIARVVSLELFSMFFRSDLRDALLHLCSVDVEARPRLLTRTMARAEMSLLGDP